MEVPVCCGRAWLGAQGCEILGYGGLESMGKAQSKGENRNMGQFQKHGDDIQKFIEEHTRTEAMLGSGEERKGIVESRAQRLWS